MGHPVLRAKARPLQAAEIRSPQCQQLIDDMFDTMREYEGVGLAAPQIHESVRLFVAMVGEEGEKPQAVALINPEISIVGKDVVEDWEGCLSIPDIRGRVPRARQVSVRAYDRTGKRLEFKASNFNARVLQHETDHLDGVLFFDRMKSFESLTFLEEFRRYAHHDDVPEE